MYEFSPISDYTPIAKNMRDKWNGEIAGTETLQLDDMFAVQARRIDDLLAAVATLEIQLGVATGKLSVVDDGNKQFIRDSSDPSAQAFRIN